MEVNETHRLIDVRGIQQVVPDPLGLHLQHIYDEKEACGAGTRGQCCGWLAVYRILLLVAAGLMGQRL